MQFRTARCLQARAIGIGTQSIDIIAHGLGLADVVYRLLVHVFRSPEAGSIGFDVHFHIVQQSQSTSFNINAIRIINYNSFVSTTWKIWVAIERMCVQIRNPYRCILKYYFRFYPDCIQSLLNSY